MYSIFNEGIIEKTFCYQLIDILKAKVAFPVALVLTAQWELK